MNKHKTIVLGGDSLNIEKLASAAYEDIPIKLSETAIKNIERGHKNLTSILESGAVAYGVNTGYGALSGVQIPLNKLKDLNINMIKSHMSGTGEPFSKQASKAVLILMANSQSKGHSGARRVLVDTIIKMINKGVYPVIPSQGSLGASGDLIPLSHAAAVLIGEGEAVYQGKRCSSRAAMKKAGIPTQVLEAREGVSLVNATHMMTALGSLSLHSAERLNKLADIALAMTLESILGLKTSVSPKVHKVRPHAGQTVTAANIRKLIDGSEIMKSHKYSSKIQDAYSLRCAPQVHGAVKDAVRYCRSTLEIEINSVTDNPMIFDQEVISAGNFHGQPLAISLDALGIAITVLGNISERRIDRLMNPQLSDLPAFLTPDPGLNCGYMMAHYLAASISFENRGLATPGSIDSVPVSANKEDFNSNGMWCARKAWQIIQNSERIIAAELLCAAQALDFLKEWKPGKGTGIAHNLIRQKVPTLKRDRILKKDINSVVDLIHSNQILESVEKTIGELKI